MGNFTLHGGRFVWEIEHDADCGAPWTEEDGHGAVRTVACGHGYSGKRPGERVLHSERRTAWLYDWAGAVVLAQRDGWGLSPDDTTRLTTRLKREPTLREIRAGAVRQDFERMRGWLIGRWGYVGVCVRLLGPDGEPETGPHAYAVWGVESDSHDYHLEVAHDLAHEILSERGLLPEQRAAAWRAALREARERRHWEQRDTLTVD